VTADLDKELGSRVSDILMHWMWEKLNICPDRARETRDDRNPSPHQSI
jgi:hypothetical protein